MDNLIVKKAVSVTNTLGKYKNEYFLIGKPRGLNCLFRIFWNGGKSSAYTEAYNVSLYEAEACLDSNLKGLVINAFNVVVNFNLNEADTMKKAEETKDWLMAQGFFDRPISNHPISVSQIIHAYKGRQKEDQRIFLNFFDETKVWLGEFKISPKLGWKNNSVVLPVCVWGKGQNHFKSAELISDYISFVGMNKYIYHELTDLSKVNLLEKTIEKLVESSEFLWTPEEEQIGIPASFIPGMQYRATKCYSIKSLWNEKPVKNGYGLLAWNDKGEVETIKEPK